MKKQISILALLCLCCACKKSSNPPNETVIVTVSNTANYTVYNLNITDNGQPAVTDDQGSGNHTFTLLETAGDKLSVSYNFTLSGQAGAPGTLDITCNGNSLFHAVGGSLSNYSITVPR